MSSQSWLGTMNNYNNWLSARLPENFSVNDLPKFKPTDDPRFHLKGFRSIMILKGVDFSLFPTVFPLSLEPVCQKWYHSLSPKDTATWEDVTHAFMTRYRGNIQTETSSRELEILKQEECEGFTVFPHKMEANCSPNGSNSSRIRDGLNHHF